LRPVAFALVGSATGARRKRPSVPGACAADCPQAAVRRPRFPLPDVVPEHASRRECDFRVLTRQKLAYRLTVGEPWLRRIAGETLGMENQALTDLIAQLTGEPRVWVRLAAHRQQEEWRLAVLEVTTREPPPLWKPSRWKYPRAVFLASAPAGKTVARWLDRGRIPLVSGSTKVVLHTTHARWSVVTPMPTGSSSRCAAQRPSGLSTHTTRPANRHRKESSSRLAPRRSSASTRRRPHSSPSSRSAIATLPGGRSSFASRIAGRESTLSWFSPPVSWFA
jgi:hypothetical protein